MFPSSSSLVDPLLSSSSSLPPSSLSAHHPAPSSPLPSVPLAIINPSILNDNYLTSTSGLPSGRSDHPGDRPRPRPLDQSTSMEEDSEAHDNSTTPNPAPSSSNRENSTGRQAALSDFFSSSDYRRRSQSALTGGQSTGPGNNKRPKISVDPPSTIAQYARGDQGTPPDRRSHSSSSAPETTFQPAAEMAQNSSETQTSGMEDFSSNSVFHGKMENEMELAKSGSTSDQTLFPPQQDHSNEFTTNLPISLNNSYSILTDPNANSLPIPPSDLPTVKKDKNNLISTSGKLFPLAAAGGPNGNSSTKINSSFPVSIKPTTIETYLNHRKMALFNPPATDNNCCFFALSAVLYGNLSRASELRSSAARYAEQLLNEVQIESDIPPSFLPLLGTVKINVVETFRKRLLTACTDELAGPQMVSTLVLALLADQLGTRIDLITSITNPNQLQRTSLSALSRIPFHSEPNRVCALQTFEPRRVNLNTKQILLVLKQNDAHYHAAMLRPDLEILKKKLETTSADGFTAAKSRKKKTSAQKPVAIADPINRSLPSQSPINNNMNPILSPSLPSEFAFAPAGPSSGSPVAVSEHFLNSFSPAPLGASKAPTSKDINVNVNPVSSVPAPSRERPLNHAAHQRRRFIERELSSPSRVSQPGLTLSFYGFSQSDRHFRLLLQLERLQSSGSPSDRLYSPIRQLLAYLLLSREPNSYESSRLHPELDLVLPAPSPKAGINFILSINSSQGDCRVTVRHQSADKAAAALAAARSLVSGRSISSQSRCPKVEFAPYQQTHVDLVQLVLWPTPKNVDTDEQLQNLFASEGFTGIMEFRRTGLQVQGVLVTCSPSEVERLAWLSIPAYRPPSMCHFSLNLLNTSRPCSRCHSVHHALNRCHRPAAPNSTSPFCKHCGDKHGTSACRDPHYRQHCRWCERYDRPCSHPITHCPFLKSETEVDIYTLGNQFENRRRKAQSIILSSSLVVAADSGPEAGPAGTDVKMIDSDTSVLASDEVVAPRHDAPPPPPPPTSSPSPPASVWTTSSVRIKILSKHRPSALGQSSLSKSPLTPLPPAPPSVVSNRNKSKSVAPPLPKPAAEPPNLSSSVHSLSESAPVHSPLDAAVQRLESKLASTESKVANLFSYCQAITSRQLDSERVISKLDATVEKMSSVLENFVRLLPQFLPNSPAPAAASHLPQASFHKNDLQLHM